MSLFQRQNSNHTECFVFIDDSNLWIAGQTALAEQLEDADRDPRFRVDLGRFLKLVTKERYISEAFLYGSIPPPNDTVWKAARDRNFEVKVFKRSGSGKEKEVDVAMASDITRKACKLPYTQNVTFIIVTGDRDLKHTINTALEEGLSIELWSWEHSLATQFRQLANEKPGCFTVEILDNVRSKFGYTAFMSTRHDKDINPACAVVFKDLPGGKEFRYWFASNIARLMRLFYVTSTASEGKNNQQDLIFEFPKTKPERVIILLKNLNLGEYKPISYPEYISSFQKSRPLSIACINRFKSLDEEANPDEESLQNAIGDIDIEPYFGMTQEDPTNNDDSWIASVRHKPGKRTRQLKQGEMSCPWEDHCIQASECRHKHTDFERSLFKKYSRWNFKFRKARPCNKLTEHTTLDQRKWCMFSHDESDSWCLKCKMYGHLTDDCRVQSSKT